MPFRRFDGAAARGSGWSNASGCGERWGKLLCITLCKVWKTPELQRVVEMAAAVHRCGKGWIWGEYWVTKGGSGVAKAFLPFCPSGISPHSGESPLKGKAWGSVLF